MKKENKREGKNPGGPRRRKEGKRKREGGKEREGEKKRGGEECDRGKLFSGHAR